MTLALAGLFSFSSAQFVSDPLKASLITTDIDHFWNAFDKIDVDSYRLLLLFVCFYLFFCYKICKFVYGLACRRSANKPMLNHGLFVFTG